MCAPHFLINGVHRPNVRREAAAAGFGHLRHWTAVIKETRLLLFKARIESATWALLVMGLVTIAVGQETIDDQQAVREFAAANPDIVFMQRVRAQEIFRIVNGGTGQPSPEVAKLMNPAAPVPKVDDPHVPLHLRIVELWRRDLFATPIELARDTAAIHCEAPQLSPEKLLEAEGRAKGLQEIQCERKKLEHYQVGAHNLYKEHEANILTLHLPKATQARVVSEAHAATVHEDKHLQSDDENALERLRIAEEYINFIAAHAAGMHVADGRIEFDDPAVYKASLKIGERLKAAAAAAGDAPP
jgi:hypothetical protein